MALTDNLGFNLSFILSIVLINCVIPSSAKIQFEELQVHRTTKQ